jgi:solute carrier family 13 (sodium-dependent dicarboxylate transporter), member 2/3/5
MPTPIRPNHEPQSVTTLRQKRTAVGSRPAEGDAPPTDRARPEETAGTRPLGPKPDEPGRRPTHELVSLILGPAAAAATFFAMGGGVDVATRSAAAVAILMAIWWMGEAMPLAATAIVPIVALPLLGVLTPEEATTPFASEIVFLFMGGFIIALALQACGLHRRIALRVLAIVGTKPRRLMLGVMLTTALMSMWVSNTAATLMMLPIATSVLDVALDPLRPTEVARRYRERLLLSVAYAATIGGLATLIGSPPTLVMAGFAQETLGITITFLDWMLIGVPLAAIFLAIAWVHLSRGTLPDMGEGGREVIAQQLRALGPVSTKERTVAVVFLVTASLWIGRPFLAEVVPVFELLSDTTVAIAAAVVLLGLPVGAQRRPILSWGEARDGLPWGVLLLFGGGLTLARGITDSELDLWIGDQVGALADMPLIVLVAIVAILILLLTEMTSNTATAATFVPVIAGLAAARGIDPLVLLVPAAFAATCAFMLPVGTPPNAIIYGSGDVRMACMVRNGVLLNGIGVVLIVAFSMMLVPMLMPS